MGHEEGSGTVESWRQAMLVTFLWRAASQKDVPGGEQCVGFKHPTPREPRFHWSHEGCISDVGT